MPPVTYTSHTVSLKKRKSQKDSPHWCSLRPPAMALGRSPPWPRRRPAGSPPPPKLPALTAEARVPRRRPYRLALPPELAALAPAPAGSRPPLPGLAPAPGLGFAASRARAGGFCLRSSRPRPKSKPYTRRIVSTNSGEVSSGGDNRTTGFVLRTRARLACCVAHTKLQGAPPAQSSRNQEQSKSIDPPPPTISSGTAATDHGPDMPPHRPTAAMVGLPLPSLGPLPPGALAVARDWNEACWG